MSAEAMRKQREVVPFWAIENDGCLPCEPDRLFRSRIAAREVATYLNERSPLRARRVVRVEVRRVEDYTRA